MARRPRNSNYDRDRDFERGSDRDGRQRDFERDASRGDRGGWGSEDERGAERAGFERDGFERSGDGGGGFGRFGGGGLGGSGGGKTSIFNTTSLAVLACVFILGIGVGIGFYSVSSSGSSGAQIDNSIQLENKLPNPEICAQFGAAAIAMDTRVFVTLKPLNVYVSRPVTQPGCVLRRSNWAVLEQRNLVRNEQVNECKQRLNTFGYTGALDNTAKIDCLYKNDAAGNLFLNQPGAVGPGGAAPENQDFN
jgi:hypothetical protein